MMMDKMNGHRSIPPSFEETFTDVCETFKHKLQCQIYTLQSPSPSQDRKTIGERLDELTERIHSIGSLAQAGEIPPRDCPAVVTQYGMRSVLEISKFIERDLQWIKGLIGKADKDVIIQHLERVMRTMPF